MTQVVLLNKIKKYFELTSSNANNQKFYLTSFSITPGFLVLKNLQDKSLSFIFKKKIYLLSLISSVRLIKPKIYYKKIIPNYNSIILTWGNIKNFDKNGNFNDKYFNQKSSNNKNFLWFIISLDNKKPKKIKNNIIIFFHNNLNLSNLFLFSFKLLKDFLLSPMQFFKKRTFFYLENLSIKLWSKLEIYIKIKKIKKFLIPYEAQPFQNYIYSKVKHYDKNIKTLGYVHSTQLFPTHLFKREGSPDKLFVHGDDQRHHCTKYLGWKRKEVNLCPSFRFFTKNKKKFYNKIFLPYDFFNGHLILDAFNKLLKKNLSQISPNMKIMLHPHTQSSKKHKILKNQIKTILRNHKFNKKIKPPLTIVIGGTSTILEALETGVKPYHIFEDDLTICSTKVWPNIKINKIHDNCFQYQLKKKNSLLNIKNSKKN